MDSRQIFIRGHLIQEAVFSYKMSNGTDEKQMRDSMIICMLPLCLFLDYFGKRPNKQTELI